MPLLSIRGLFVSVLLSLAVSSPLVADVQVFGAKASVWRVMEHELGSEQAKTWRKFSQACCYFGAYAINTSADLGYFSQGFNSRKLAISAAKAGCVEVSRAQGADPKACRIYGYSIPAEADPKDPASSGFGMTAREGFKTLYQVKQTKVGYGAFAIAPALGWGASWNWPTRAKAQEAALAHCRADLAQVIADIGPPAGKWVAENAAGTCEVVHETAPTN